MIYLALILAVHHIVFENWFVAGSYHLSPFLIKQLSQNAVQSGLSAGSPHLSVCSGPYSSNIKFCGYCGRALPVLTQRALSSNCCLHASISPLQASLDAYPILVDEDTCWNLLSPATNAAIVEDIIYCILAGGHLRVKGASYA